jgi:raffinose/stachyose/melibiose transport system permease protein
MQNMPKKYYAFFTLPTMIAFAIAFFIPFILGIYLSFTKFRTVTNSQWVGFINYVHAFTDNNDFLNATIFTVKFAIVSVVLINLFAFALALLLTRALRGTNIFRTVFFMPNLIGGIVLGYIWLLIINGILINFGVDITYSAKFGFWGLVVVTNWQMVGYMMVIYIAAIQSISTEQLEAAQIDGANAWQILKSITIPLWSCRLSQFVHFLPYRIHSSSSIKTLPLPMAHLVEHHPCLLSIFLILFMAPLVMKV